MEKQASLIPLEPSNNAYEWPSKIRAHRGDPVTSHEAAERVEKGGRRQRNCEIAVALVRASPGKTGFELWAGATSIQREYLGSHHELFRCLADAKNREILKQGEPRKWTVKGVRDGCLGTCVKHPVREEDCRLAWRKIPAFFR